MCALVRLCIRSSNGGSTSVSPEGPGRRRKCEESRERNFVKEFAIWPVSSDPSSGAWPRSGPVRCRRHRCRCRRGGCPSRLGGAGVGSTTPNPHLRPDPSLSSAVGEGRRAGVAALCPGRVRRRLDQKHARHHRQSAGIVGRKCIRIRTRSFLRHWLLRCWATLRWFKTFNDPNNC